QTKRHLSVYERELAWVAILIACDEAIGTHHLDLFMRAGGTRAQAATVLRLVALLRGSDAFEFVDKHWSHHLPACAGSAAYEAGIDARVDKRALDRRHVDLAMAAAAAALRKEWALAAHITAAYRARIPEVKLVEAMTLIMWPAGVNAFLDATTLWYRMM